MDIQNGRCFLKSNAFSDLDLSLTDQGKDLPEPPLQKACDKDALLVNLIPPDEFSCGQMDLLTILRKRKSRRTYSNDFLTLEELSYLLWSVQGVKKIVKNGYATLRTVPSAGARHPFETYVIIFKVENLKNDLYRYLPLEHKLILISTNRNFACELNEACYNQKFIVDAAAVFIWTVVPYRSEWRYDAASYKCIALDAGHLCQNLYLASESISAGTCAVAAYDQEKMDALLGVDGKEEFAIYMAPVGKQNK